METEYINYLSVIVESGSLNKAAKILNIPPHRLGRIVTNIENEFGIMIFERTRRGIVLTESGIYFIEKMHEINSILTDIYHHSRKTSEKSNDIEGSIVFYARRSFTYCYFSQAVYHFRDDYPNCEITYYQTNNTSLILDQISKNHNTIGCVARPSNKEAADPLSDHPGLSSHTLYRQMPVALISKDNPIIHTNQANISLKTLSQIPLIVLAFDNDTNHFTSLDSFFQYNYSPTQVIRAGSQDDFCDFIARGKGVALIPKNETNNALFTKRHPNICIVPIRESFFYNFDLIYKPSKITQLCETFIGYLFDNRPNYSKWTQNTQQLIYQDFDKPILKNY